MEAYFYCNITAVEIAKDGTVEVHSRVKQVSPLKGVQVWINAWLLHRTVQARECVGEVKVTGSLLEMSKVKDHFEDETKEQSVVLIMLRDDR